MNNATGTILLAEDLNNRTSLGRKRTELLNRYTRKWSEALGCPINLLYVDDPAAYSRDLIRDPKKRADREKESRSRLRELSLRLPVAAEPTQQKGSPVEEILKASRRDPSTQVIVLGTHGRKGLKRWWLGSVAEEVVRQSRIPVMTIGPMAKEVTAKKFSSPLRILVATDLGEGSRPAEEFALKLAKQLGAKVVLFHVLMDGFKIVQGSLAFPESSVQMAQMLAQLKADSMQVLKDKVAWFKDADVACRYVTDNQATRTGEAISEFSSRFDVVVLGTQGRNLLVDSVLGGAAHTVILKSPVPVITVRSKS